MAEVKDKVITAESLKCAVDALRKAYTTKIPTKVSDLTNDSGFITSVPDEIYVGNGDMPETATIQILMDGSDEEQSLKDELKEYIDGEIEKITPELGVDYFTENDKNEIATRVCDLIKNGGVVGFVDENNNIVLTGNIADGEYTLKYENVDGTYTNIGTLEVGAVEPEEPKVVNLFNPDTAIYNARLGASGDLKAEGSCNGAVVTDFIDITDLNGKIKISGNFVQSTSYSGLKFGKLVVYDASGVMAGTSSAITYDITPDGREYDLTNCKTTYPTATQIRLCLSIKASETITAEDVADVVIELIE